MPLLHRAEGLPDRPRRVLVAGTSGSGKTTAAVRIAAVLGVPHTEIDGLFHGPGWTERPSFEADVAALAASSAWVTEWQYPAVRPLLASRTDLLVWLDLPRRTVMRQVVLRTLRRRLGRQRLWGVNIEPPLLTFLSDRDHIVRWAWRTHPEPATRVAALLVEQPGLAVVRITGRGQLDAWIDGPLRASTRR
jgi:adenylate kinase family enzyme